MKPFFPLKLPWSWHFRWWPQNLISCWSYYKHYHIITIYWQTLSKYLIRLNISFFRKLLNEYKSIFSNSIFNLQLNKHLNLSFIIVSNISSVIVSFYLFLPWPWPCHHDLDLFIKKFKMKQNLNTSIIISKYKHLKTECNGNKNLKTWNQYKQINPSL